MILALLIIVTLLLSACTPENNTIVPKLSITLADGGELDGHAVNIAEEGGQVRVDIASNSNWHAKSNAEWIEFSQQEGNGDSSITLTAETAEKSRSAAVEIYLSDYTQIRATFDIIQHIEPAEEQPEENTGEEDDNTEDTPEDNPTEEENPEENNGSGEQNPKDESGDNNTSEDNQEENPEDGNEDNGEQNPEEDTTEGDEENPENNPDENIGEEEDNTTEEDPEDDTENNGDNPNEENNDGNNENDDNTENDDTPEPQQDIFVKIENLAQLSEGEYYIGGYQDGVLHLASGGMNVGHCNTAQYTFADTGTLTPAGEKEAVTVTLEKATDGYYIHFDEGYLTATAAGPGKLIFSDKKINYWIFSAHPEGGFILRQSGDIDVQLIISPKAKNGSLLRSIAGDEEGNAIILFRKNE